MLTSHQVAVIIPTKGRPRQLKKLLETLSAQTVPFGQILVADGGQDQKALVNSFSDSLAVTWLACPVPGQIPQRNFALQHLDDGIHAVIYLDDDIQVEPSSTAKLISFFNAQHPMPAGVSFNLGNLPEQSSSLFRRLFFMDTRPYGKILKSGYNTPIVNLQSDILNSDWLIGGATLWRRDILQTHQLSDLPSDWAICEDIIFSYPVSQIAPLHVCASARAYHVDDERVLTGKDGRKRGRAAVLWRAWFVQKNSDLSKAAFLWMNFGMLLGWGARAMTGNCVAMGYFHGTVSGVAVVVTHWITGKDISDAIR